MFRLIYFFIILFIFLTFQTYFVFGSNKERIITPRIEDTYPNGDTKEEFLALNNVDGGILRPVRTGLSKCFAWNFRVKKKIVITRLGLLAKKFSHAHDIALYEVHHKITATKLVQSKIPPTQPGRETAVIKGFRFADLLSYEEQVILYPGKMYQISGHYRNPPDLFLDGVDKFTMSAEVEIISSSTIEDIFGLAEACHTHVDFIEPEGSVPLIVGPNFAYFVLSEE